MSEDLPPALCERFNITKTIRPIGGYEHRCQQAPLRTDRKGLRVLLDPGLSPSWYIYKTGSQDFIMACPWCAVTLPKVSDLICTCRADDAVDHEGFGEIVVRQQMPLNMGRSVSLRVRARVIQVLHEDSCPCCGMRTRGSYG